MLKIHKIIYYAKWLISDHNKAWFVKKEKKRWNVWKMMKKKIKPFIENGENT